MIFCYKDLKITYHVISSACVLGTVIWAILRPDMMWINIAVMSSIIILMLFILHPVANRRFEKEVVSLLNDCRISEFMDRLTARIGTGGSKAMKSSYASFCVIGYDLLGDYEALYEKCLLISHKSNMHIRHRGMFSYYLNKDQEELAASEIKSLYAMREKIRSGAAKARLDDIIGICETALHVKQGKYEGAEEFYTKMLSSQIYKTTVSRVSFSYALGSVLVLKGERDRAAGYLKFASEHGGDTKYRKLADDLLASVN